MKRVPNQQRFRMENTILGDLVCKGRQLSHLRRREVPKRVYLDQVDG